MADRLRRFFVIGFVIGGPAMFFLVRGGSSNDGWEELAAVAAGILGAFVGAILGGAIGAAIGVFGLFMAIGRFLGDRLSDRFGPTMIARICGVLAVAGVALTTLAGGLIVAMIGFVAMGLGVSIGFPLAVSAAAARGDRPPATNVAGVALFAYSSSLVGPTMVGFVADAAGLRIGFATVLPLIVLSTLLASQLRPRPRPAGS